MSVFNRFIINSSSTDVNINDTKTLNIICNGLCQFVSNTNQVKSIGIGVHIPLFDKKYDLSLGLNRFELDSNTLPALTNSHAEIISAIFALQQAISITEKHPKIYENVTFHSDSLFLINVMNKNLKIWIEKNWEPNNHNIVLYKQVFEALLSLCFLLDNVTISWNCLKRSENNIYNRIAMGLAQQATQ